MNSMYLAVLFVFLIPVMGYTQYFPEKDWVEKEPSAFGIDEVILDKAVMFAKENHYSGSKDLRQAILKAFQREPFHEIKGPTKRRGGPAGLILKEGYIIAKWGDIKRVDMTFSVTKSYLSTVAGIALDLGLIESVDDKVQKYVWDGYFDSDHNAKITWYHLLTQSSDWSGELFGMPDWSDRPPKEGGIDDWRNRKLIEPGSKFEYNDVRVNLLSYSLMNVWRKPLPEVLKEHIMDPIGASTTWRWYGYENSWVTIDGIKMQCVSGGGHSGGGLFINTEDHARFGLLFMREGKWKDRQLISNNWIESIQLSSEANQSYSYMWWLNKGSKNWELSDSVYYAAGFGGNYIIIDKEHELVIIIRWLESGKLDNFMALISNAFD